MQTLSLDLETFSSVDLSKAGVYRYAESPDFEILLFGYSVDGGEPQVIDLAQGDEIPVDILDALTDDDIIKWAYNANFERVCLSRYLSDLGISLDSFYDRHSLSTEMARFLNPSSWHCSMVWAATLGLPLSLAGVGKVLNLSDQKLKEGKDLIRYFCVPDKQTGKRHLPSEALDKWETFKAYNRRDVEVELAIKDRLKNYKMPDFLWDEYAVDQEINDRGVKVDLALADVAVEMDRRSKNELITKMKNITNLENPNSVAQMKDWLAENGMPTESLGKKQVAELIQTAPPKLRDALVLRSRLAKSSVKKYQAMQNAACKDGRVRGMFQFYGANRTGRWAGRLVQMQNLPRNHLPDLDAARALVKSEDFDAMKLLYDDVPDTLSQLVRTAFIPQDGCKFIVADYSAIEARVIAWYAGQQDILNAFVSGKDLYCETASRMFCVPVVKHGINGELRQKGKIAVLACGYGGSVGALKAMGALEMGLSEAELKPLVDAWRSANPNIVKFWWDVDKAVLEAVRHKKTTKTHGLTFTCKHGMLFITLPSGRNLAYVKPKMGENRFGSPCVTYEGITTGKKWSRIDSYGPKFVENIVQATARDILAYAMRTLRNCSIVMHIHDEVVIEANPRMSLDAVCEQMSLTPPWAEGLPLKADGYECAFYKKD
ncbi:MAG: DNA polymerase [Atopobium minutum]|uniref:DNA polymerase n=1 Tax=Atopobium minutum TaxID=1381 RepID=UPI00290BE2B2|nr:DNA polymerase [Atopobium minutum]MDU5357774.1 DNA polymerase [Atopobium minutum]